MDSTGTVIEAQADWLTCSAHGEEASERLLDLALHIAVQERERGGKPVRWRLMGYEGTHIGAVEYGRRDRAASMIRLIGQAAADNLTRALSVADAVTRLDIATTWRATPPDPHLGANTYTQAELFHRKHPRSALPSQTMDGGGGHTVYLGARTSDYFLRVYNKEAECRLKHDQDGAERYKGCWRYELEVKGPMASQLADRLNGEEDRAAYVQRYVAQWVEAHGIAPPFDASGGRVLLPGFRRRSDAESKIRHLSRNVRPTVDWLKEAGMLEEALQALGIG